MPIAEKTAKEHILELVENQPADASFDEIFQELALARMIERGLADAEAGRVIPHEELERRAQSWGRKLGHSRPKLPDS